MSHVTPEVALAISRQKARYARYADTKQWSRFEKVGLPDGRFSFLGVDGEPLMMGKALVFDTARSFAAFFESFFAGLETMHNLSPGDFEKSEEKADEVKAVFGFEDQLLSKTLGSWVEIRGGGFYTETWKLVDGEWYIKELTMRRTYQKASMLAWLGITVASAIGYTPKV